MTRAVTTLAGRAPVFPGASTAEVGFCLRLGMSEIAHRVLQPELCAGARLGEMHG